MPKLTHRVTLYIPKRQYGAVSSAIENLAQVCGGCTVVDATGAFFLGAYKCVEPVALITAWFSPTLLDHVQFVVNAAAAQMRNGGEKCVMVEWFSPTDHYSEILE